MTGAINSRTDLPGRRGTCVRAEACMWTAFIRSVHEDDEGEAYQALATRHQRTGEPQIWLYMPI
jgi:hypothetical protein